MLDWLALLLLIRLKWREHRRPYVPLDPAKICLHGILHVALYCCPCCKQLILTNSGRYNEDEVIELLQSAADQARMERVRRKLLPARHSLRIIKPGDG